MEYLGILSCALVIISSHNVGKNYNPICTHWCSATMWHWDE